MQASDLIAARRLWSESDGVELSEGDSIAELTRYLVRNPELSQVAYRESDLVGAVLAGHDGRRGFLYHLAVAREHRARAIGQELVARAVAALQRAGVRRALILVARDNDTGRRFWTKQAWEPLDQAEVFGRDL